MKARKKKTKTQLYRELLEKLRRKLLNNSNMEDVLCGNRMELNCYDGRGIYDLLCKFERIKSKKVGLK